VKADTPRLAAGDDHAGLDGAGRAGLPECSRPARSDADILADHPGARLENIRVVVAGDTAVLTGWVSDEVRRGVRDQTFRLRLTMTWVRTARGWRCLAGHASLPA
jgi:ketosteroid isomerase-like protein